MINFVYSPIEHLAKAIWFSHWRESSLAMFSAYFDASGQEETKTNLVVSVAGFVAPAEVWSDFDIEWRARLKEDGFDGFHMAHCANFAHEFEDWKDKKIERQKLLRSLIALLKPLSRKFACAIPLKEYRTNLEPVYLEDPLFKAYSMAGRWCASRLRQWTWREKYPSIDNVGLFYEHGDNWQDELKKQLIGDQLPCPNFKPKFDRYDKKNEVLIERGLVPFQASDILAYLTFLKYKFELKQQKDWGDKEDIKWMLEEIKSNVIGPIDYVKEQDIYALNVLARVSGVDLLKEKTENL